MTRRQTMIAALLVSLAALTLWAGGWRSDCLAAARQAKAALQQCQSDADAIAARQTFAGDADTVGDDIQAAVERAAETAGIPAATLSRITPEPARRVGNSVYVEQPTRVRLSEVSLKQLVVFAHTLTADHGGLNIHTIQIRAPRADDTTDTWIAEIVLTYLTYDPVNGR